MGLGKTIEILTLATMNTPKGFDYGTLVVCPGHLFHQWRDEIEKHTSLSYETMDEKSKTPSGKSADILLVHETAFKYTSSLS
jgi:SNF2 family DNA or RNA helicase